MRSIDIFCASQAATTTMDSDIHHRPSSSSSSSAIAGRAIDRHNPIIHHQNRLTTTTLPPTTTTIPNPTKNNNKNKKKLIKIPKSSTAFGDENKDEQNKDKDSNHHNKKPHDGVRRQGGVLLGWGCTRPGDFISPANSSRFLLTDKALLSDQFDPLLNQPSPPLPPPPPPPAAAVKVNKSDDGIDKSFKKDEVNVLSSSPVKTPPRPSSSSSSDQQVVVLRVSLHCRGCEKKMRKHISKMEGVTSFTIDFLAKKVTVVGDVTPLAVLTSISKVKNAKLLTPMTIAVPPVPPTGSNISEIKKQLGVVA